MNILRAPFLFLLIRFPGRAWYVFITPLLVSLGSVLALESLGHPIAISGANGLFSKLLDIMPIAGGFFVAALTVILSHSNSVIQSKFSGSYKPVLKSDKEDLTRQRFLALLFGYLAFSSFVISGLLIFADLLSLPLRAEFTIEGWWWLRTSVLVGVLFWVTQMFSCSLIGLFYLTDRLHRSDGQANFKRQLPKSDN